MRNSLIGALLATVLIAGLFAASHYLSHPGKKAAPALGPGQIAAMIKPNFVGVQSIGAWTLVCGPGKQLPRPPAGDGHVSGNSEGTAPKEPPPPPGWKIPRCRTVIGLHSSHNPGEYVRLAFRQVGFKRVLALFLRFPPNEVQTGDIVSVGLDGAAWQIPVRSCAMQFCLAVQSIKIGNVPAIEESKQLTLSFKTSSRPGRVKIAVPTSGLADSLRTMRRIDK